MLVSKNLNYFSRFLWQFFVVHNKDIGLAEARNIYCYSEESNQIWKQKTKSVFANQFKNLLLIFNPQNHVNCSFSFLSFQSVKIERLFYYESIRVTYKIFLMFINFFIFSRSELFLYSCFLFLHFNQYFVCNVWSYLVYMDVKYNLKFPFYVVAVLRWRRKWKWIRI